MKNYAKLFENLHAYVTGSAKKSSKIIRENGLFHFWVKDFMTLGDGYTSLETLVYNLNEKTGVVTIYRPVNGRHLDEHTLDLKSF